MVGPQTGDPADADMRHRCAVRLTAGRHAGCAKAARSSIRCSTGHRQARSLRPRRSPAGHRDSVVARTTRFRFRSASRRTYHRLEQKEQIDSEGQHRARQRRAGRPRLSSYGRRSGHAFRGPALFLPPNPAADRCSPTARFRAGALSPAAFPTAPSRRRSRCRWQAARSRHAIRCICDEQLCHARGREGPHLPDGPGREPVRWPHYLRRRGCATTPLTRRISISPSCSIRTGGAAASDRPVLETFTDLSLTTGDPIMRSRRSTQFRASSRSGLLTPGRRPAGFPSTPEMLASAGTTRPEGHGRHHLSDRAANESRCWPPLFGVLAQDDLPDPTKFNLLVVYQPPSGGVGVPAPVVVEQFDSLSLGTVAARHRRLGPDHGPQLRGRTEPQPLRP